MLNNNDEILLLMAAGEVVHQFIVATYFIFLDSAVSSA
jgi:hypothetical protein